MTDINTKIAIKKEEWNAANDEIRYLKERIQKLSELKKVIGDDIDHLTQTSRILEQYKRPNLYRAIIDTDGGILRSEDGKLNSYFCGMVGLLIIDSKFNIIDEYSSEIAFTTTIDDLTSAQKRNWHAAKTASHQREFSSFNINSVAGRIYNVYDDIDKLLNHYRIDTIYAKGIYLDKRFLCNIGINGVFLEKKIATKMVNNNTRYRWINLTDLGISKFKGVHVPIDECKTFLKEMKEKNIK